MGDGFHVLTARAHSLPASHVHSLRTDHTNPHSLFRSSVISVHSCSNLMFPCVFERSQGSQRSYAEKCRLQVLDVECRKTPVKPGQSWSKLVKPIFFRA